MLKWLKFPRLPAEFDASVCRRVPLQIRFPRLSRPRRYPPVSVVIPTRDRPRLLAEALASVRALDGPDLRLQVIVADNGSAQDLRPLARRFGATLVRVSAPGPSAARNAGLSAATGEFIAFLDDDDLWTPHHLRPHLDFLARHPDFDAVLGQILPIDEAGRPLAEPYPEDLPADGMVFRQFLEKMPQIGALVARTSVLRRLGGFDESLTAAEEWDLYLRLALVARVGFVPVPSIIFRIRPPGRADEDELTRYRAGVVQHVFWRNVRRARALRPPLYAILRSYLRHIGFYAGILMVSAEKHLENGNRSNARRAARWAALESPAHFGFNLILRPDWRRLVLKAFF